MNLAGPRDPRFTPSWSLCPPPSPLVCLGLWPVALPYLGRAGQTPRPIEGRMSGAPPPLQAPPFRRCEGSQRRTGERSPSALCVCNMGEIGWLCLLWSPVIIGGPFTSKVSLNNDFHAHPEKGRQQEAVGWAGSKTGGGEWLSACQLLRTWGVGSLDGSARLGVWREEQAVTRSPGAAGQSRPLL